MDQLKKMEALGCVSYLSPFVGHTFSFTMLRSNRCVGQLQIIS